MLNIRTHTSMDGYFLGNVCEYIYIYMYLYASSEKDRSSFPSTFRFFLPFPDNLSQLCDNDLGRASYGACSIWALFRSSSRKFLVVCPFPKTWKARMKNLLVFTHTLILIYFIITLDLLVHSIFGNILVFCTSLNDLVWVTLSTYMS